jgi:CubicO group peptidase (beta-lactamase class C family)
MAASGSDRSDDFTARIQRIEAGIQPEPALRSQEPEGRPLAERMAYHTVPGVSLAVIHDYQVMWASGFGVREAGNPEPVTARTLFQAASISKPVAAVAALRLVQDGTLDLDRDVNDYLTHWQVPANGRWQPRVTLRHLLSHSAGLTVHGFPGYRRDRPLPTLLQILAGEPPANSLPIRVNAVPGTQFRYAGGGYVVLQQLLEDVTGLSFSDLLRALVFEPLGMRDSTYEQPLPAARWDTVAAGHRTGGGVVAGGWHVYREQAAAGLWTTASDLARLAADIQRALAELGPSLLRPETAREMVTAQIEEQPGTDFGLGFQLAGAGGARRFCHSGSNEGYQCMLVACSSGGSGAVVMTNGDEGDALVQEVLRAVAREEGWPAIRRGGWRR